ncbi:MAG: PilZ domain-containing protein [Allosphingosinicella sp.]
MTEEDFAAEDQGDHAEARRAPRRKLLLSAQMESDAVTGPVRIRDLSDVGALLEGVSFPQVGATLMLRRQALQIRGTIAWNSGSRCGVKFDAGISVADWIAGASSGKAGARAQARVDDIQAAIRAGHKAQASGPAAAAPAPASAATDADGLDRRIAAELSYVRRLLDDVGEALVEEPILLRRHGAALQAFDIACQILGHLGTVLAAEDRAAAVDTVDMLDLRARLTRRRLFDG